VFDSLDGGCGFSVFGVYGSTGAIGHFVVEGNLFKNLSSFACEMPNPTPTNSSLVFRNNTISNARGGGVETRYVMDATIENNVFFETGKALVRWSSGEAAKVSYNCFYNNATNFSGYPGIYGLVITSNQNNDPSDVFFNIFLNPRFTDSTRFLLSNFSPCVDAGNPAISDTCFPISKGGANSDMGAYGGPEACGWLQQGFGPVIVQQPQNQTGCIGGEARFSAAVYGAEPLSYQWLFNQTNVVPGATSSNLVLINLQTNQAGYYSVSVSNEFGQTISAPARLLVYDACVGIHAYAGLSITGIVGRTYYVQYVTNVDDNNWMTLVTNTLSTPTWLFIDTESASLPRRFYRAILKP